MLEDRIIARIDSVDSVDEFDYLMYVFNMSDAPLDVKEEAIHTLKSRKSVFNLESLVTDSKVLEEIAAGQPDLDDIN